jgi:chitin disaccharide deacetylase
MMAQDALRPIWLCADDYGISASVNKAIRDLVSRGRINATSVMVAAPGLSPAEAASLGSLNDGARRVAIGLHVTLTAPFRPMTLNFRPARDGHFLSHEWLLARGMLRMLDGHCLAVEIATQLKAFAGLFGRPPDFVDGHQHVQLFPQVREAFLDVVRTDAPRAWVRQCGRIANQPGRFAVRKALVLDVLSRKFCAHAAALGIKTNPAFAGAYDFAAASGADFAQLFPGFLQGMPAGGVVMCHPGFVDAELERLDPLTTMREREYEFLADDAFPGLLRAQGVALA